MDPMGDLASRISEVIASGDDLAYIVEMIPDKVLLENTDTDVVAAVKAIAKWRQARDKLRSPIPMPPA